MFVRWVTYLLFDVLCRKLREVYIHQNLGRKGTVLWIVAEGCTVIHQEVNRVFFFDDARFNSLLEFPPTQLDVGGVRSGTFSADPFQKKAREK